MSLAEPRVRVPPGVETVFDAAIAGAVFSDAGLLAAGLGDGTVRLVGPHNDVKTVQAHDGAALCLTLDIDGTGVVTGGDDVKVVRTSPDGTRTELQAAPSRRLTY